jgi:(p)ppGpp synthase/HD superfamily hydrolase
MHKSQYEQYYNLIKNFYGETKAKRSGVPYMNHIDEGIVILSKIGASLNAIKAYCLHPIVQDDSNVLDGINLITRTINDYFHISVVLAISMEYRNVANRGLSCYQVDNPEHIYLSPIKDVNDMLIADKVQNRKDFLKYHLGTHPKSKELDVYFKNWLRRLEVTEAMYDDLVCDLNK